MPTRLLFLLLLAACSASSQTQTQSRPKSARKSTSKAEAASDPRTRIYYRQYYQGGHTFVVENLAGRDLVKLRSRPIRQGQVPVAYVPDDVMRALLRRFEKYDFDEYARPLPSDPQRYAVAELTIVHERKSRAWLRKRRAPGAVSDAYKKEAKQHLRCLDAFLQTWNAHRPTMQATVGTSDVFGAKRVHGK